MVVLGKANDERTVILVEVHVEVFPNVLGIKVSID